MRDGLLFDAFFFVGDVGGIWRDSLEENYEAFHEK
jgi:hypothetical protein